MTVHNPRKAWIRAIVYFTICLIVGAVSGTLRSLFSSPVVTDPQLQSVTWWLSLIVVSAHVVFAYLWFWPRGTVTLGRPLRSGYALLFGFLWGFCQGLLMLSVFRYIESYGLRIVWNVAVMFGVYSVFIGSWQSRYWDIYVSPPHNIEEWNLRKVLVCHVPFLLLALTHLAIYNNAAIFIGWQIVALMASSWSMRFPAPGDEERAY